MVADEPAAPRAGGRLPTDLDAEEQRILAYASAIGSEFDFPLLVRAMDADEEALAERLERLVHRGILRERRGGDRYGFAEEEFRARTYRALTESRLRVLHRKIAAALEALGPPSAPGRASELGRHFFLGKVPEKSLVYNRKAAEEARSAEEPERAVHHYERALLELDHVPGEHRQERAEILLSVGDLVFSLGNYASADRYYRRALEATSASDPNLTARLLLARAEIAREGLDGAAAGRGALEARELFEASGDPVGVAQTHRLLGRLAFSRGAYAESLEENMRSLELLEGNRDPHLMGLLSIDLGNSFALLGAEGRPVAIDWYQHAIDRLTGSGDWGELSRAYHNLAVSIGESHPQDGLEYLAKARETAERAHDARSAGWALLSGVEMRLGLGQVEEAGRDNQQAARAFEHLADNLGLEQVELNRGEIAERRGQWEDSEGAYRSAIELCRKFGLDADAAEAHYRLARLLSKTRDWDRAREAFAAAERLGLPRVRPNLSGAFEELRATIMAGDTAPVEPSPPPADPRPL